MRLFFCTIQDGHGNSRTAAALSYSFATLQFDHDFIVIDTPSGEPNLSLVVHGMADTLFKVSVRR